MSAKRNSTLLVEPADNSGGTRSSVTTDPSSTTVGITGSPLSVTSIDPAFTAVSRFTKVAPISRPDPGTTSLAHGLRCATIGRRMPGSVRWDKDHEVLCQRIPGRIVAQLRQPHGRVTGQSKHDLLLRRPVSEWDGAIPAVRWPAQENADRHRALDQRGRIARHQAQQRR